MYLVGEGDGDFGLFVGDAFKVEVDEEDGDGEDVGDGTADETRLAIVLKLGFFRIDRGATECDLKPRFGEEFNRSCGVERVELSFRFDKSGVRGGVGAKR